jgi:pimeloyl-ACP methyl ester carboxylesterase
MNSLLYAIICAALLLGAGQRAVRMAGEEGRQEGTLAGERLILPTVADPQLKTEFDSPNVVVLPKGTARKELVVLLPGTGGKPAQYRELIQTLVAGGYKVIGLGYDNKPTEAVACDASGDLDCHRHFREERFRGDSPEATVQNTPAEGIEHRLTMLLEYLVRQFPAEGWDQYLDGGKPAWKRMVIAGHSQGSGHAAYIAKNNEVARVVLFSGPYDGIDLRKSPKLSTWLSEPSKTPMDRWYAEYHEKDLGAPIPPLTLAALKVPEDHIIVSKLASPVETTIAYHMMGTHDPRMVPQWQWLFGISGGVK